MAEGYVYDWDDTIENDGADYEPLPEGDYVFTVKTFERGRFPGSTKIPPCNKAILTLEIDAPEGRTTIKTDLILFSSLEWKISSFFRSIGQKKRGEKLTMNWAKVPGSTGRAHITIRAYTDKDGKARRTNDVDRFLDPEETAAPEPAKEKSAARPAARQTAKAATRPAPAAKPAAAAPTDDDLPF